jgi:itaconate CoA-transferase
VTQQDPPRGPLAGVHVIGLEQSVAGPLCTRILADMGARVTKVERPGRGDFARGWDTHANGFSSYLCWLNQKKQSIALDLGDQRGREILDHLLARADVLVCNMSVPAIERLGLTRVNVQERYPNLIACFLTGYGLAGEHANRKAYDMLVQAEAGIMSLTGDPGEPTRVGVSLSDIGTGLYAAVAVLGALIERASTKTGRVLDVSMFEAMLEFAGPNLVAFGNSSAKHPKSRTRHHAIVPYGIFECSDRSLCIAVEQDSEWRRFATDVIERPDLAMSRRYSSNEKRCQQREELERAIEGVLATKPAAFWIGRLEAADVAFASINDIEEVWEHVIVRDLGLRATVTLPDGRSAAVIRPLLERAFGLDGHQPRIPNCDEQADEVLEEAGITRPDRV